MTVVDLIWRLIVMGFAFAFTGVCLLVIWFV